MFKIDSCIRIDVSSFNELHSDSVSNSIALVPTDMSEGKSDSLEMEHVATDFHNSFSLNSCSNVSKANHSQISVENIINSGDECLEDEFKTATHPKVTEKDVSIKELSSHRSITGVAFDNLDKKLKESEKQLNESKSHHHETGNDDLYALSNRLVSLSSDSSLDTDEDLEDALFKANLSQVRDFNGGRRIRTRRSPRLSKIDPVTTIVCTRIQKNVSTKRKNSSKIVIAKEAASEVTSVASKSNFNPQGSNTCGDRASSDDSVICLEDDDDYVDDNSGVNLSKTLNRENLVLDRSSSILNSKFQVYPKNNITPGISSFYHIVPPKASSSSILTSCKTLSSSNLAFSSSKIILSSSSLTLYSSSVQMTSSRISTSFPHQEFKSVFSDKRIDNLVPSYTRTIESRPVAKLLCEIGSLFVNGYLSNSSTSHQKYKRFPSTVTICNSGKLEVMMDHFRTGERSIDDFKVTMTRCSCGFMTESANVLQHHYELGRESGGLQHCCLCDDYSARYSSQFARHMELEHDQKVRVLPKPWTYLCQLCTFETNGRAIHEKHVRNCQRLFSIKSNQRPNPSDCDIPILKTDVKTETLSFGGEFVTNEALVEMRNEPSISRSVGSTSEPKLLQIGNHLFVLMKKPIENMTTATSLSQCNSQLGLVKSDKQVPQTSMTTSMRDHDSSSDDKMQPSCDKQTFPNATAEQLAPVLPASLVMPVFAQDISPSGTWVSRLAAAAAKSVISNKPALSKMAAMPIKTLTTPEHLSVVSVASAVSPSSDIFKRVAQYASDRVTPSVKTNRTALIASSSASDVSRKCSLHVSKAQGNPSVSISGPNSFCQLSLPTTEPSKLRLLTDATDIPLPVRSLRKDARSESQDSFVICPLCSGFVKDFECLETHMTICHKNADTSLASIRNSQCIPVKCLPTTTALCKQQLDLDFSDNSVGHCPHCGLSGISDILAHVKEKHNVALLNMCNGRYCVLCRCLFESTKALEKHVMESHSTLGSDVNIFRKEIYSSDARVMCPVCGKKDLFNLVRHMENRHNVTMIEMLKLLFCNFCSYNSQDPLDFESHMLECHSDLFPSRDYLWDEIFTKQKSSHVSDPSDEFGGTFKCSSCDDEFVTASYRYRHEIMSHPNLPFVSLLFKKNLETSEVLARHQNVDHLGLSALSCKRSSTDKFAKFNSSNGNSSSKAVNLRSSPETVVITDEEEEIVEPCVKQPRLETERVTEAEKSIPVENIEEVLEIDGETVIIVQERD